MLTPTFEVVDFLTVSDDLKDFATGLDDHHSLAIDPIPQNISYKSSPIDNGYLTI